MPNQFEGVYNGNTFLELAPKSVARSEDGNTASAEIKKDEQFYHHGTLYKATITISQGSAIVTSGSGQNCEIAPTVTGQIKSLDDSKVGWDDAEGYVGENFNNGVSEFTFVKGETDKRTITLPINKALTVGDVITLAIKVDSYSTVTSDLSQFFFSRVGQSHQYSDVNYIDVTKSGIQYIKFKLTGTPTSEENRLYLGIPSGWTDNDATITVSDMRILDVDTNVQLTQNKADNSVIGNVEDGTTVKNDSGYAVGSHAIRNGAFITWKNAKAQGEAINDVSDYESGDVATQFGLYIPIANNAGFHNSIFRGKNLGSTVTTAQRNAITAGTFDDMYIGDYWEISSVKYRIAHFDYWLNCGDTGGVGICTSHHVVVVPDSALVNKRMNAKIDNVDTTAGAYVNSEMRTTNLADAKTIVNTAFGADNILTHREYMQNAVTDGYESGGAWVNADIELMSEIMVYGSNIFHNVKCGTALPNLYTVNKTQLALFRLDPSFIICKNVAQTDQSGWWLRDVVSATAFAYVNGYGCAHNYGASASLGVRPAFGIK